MVVMEYSGVSCSVPYPMLCPFFDRLRAQNVELCLLQVKSLAQACTYIFDNGTAAHLAPTV